MHPVLGVVRLPWITTWMLFRSCSLLTFCPVFAEEIECTLLVKLPLCMLFPFLETHAKDWPSAFLQFWARRPRVVPLPQLSSVGSLRTQGDGLDTTLSSVMHRGTSKQIHISQINKHGTYDMKCQCLRLSYLSYSLQKHFPDMHIWPYHDPAMHGWRIASNSLMSLSCSCDQVKMILLEIGKETRTRTDIWGGG